MRAIAYYDSCNGFLPTSHARGTAHETVSRNGLLTPKTGTPAGLVVLLHQMDPSGVVLLMSAAMSLSISNLLIIEHAKRRYHGISPVFTVHYQDLEH